MQENISASNLVFIVESFSLVLAGKKILDNISFTIRKGEHWLITGPSGSGKTTLAESLANYRFHGGAIHCPGNPRVSFIGQQHHFKTRSNTSTFYYQQRFQSMDAEDSLTVAEFLETDASIDPNLQYWIDSFGITPLLSKPLIQLSNGENKRVQMVAALTDPPEVMILDNPFTGLDATGRKILHIGLNQLAEAGIQLIIVSNGKDYPICITNTYSLGNGSTVHSADFAPELPAGLPALNAPFTYPVKMNNVHIQYGTKVILDKLNWEIRKGEKWLLSGPNGSGKSTLLSLITADNPQAYANDISLFDKKRGTGESIWDIKKNIGYLSPELHLNFDQFSAAGDVIGSGFFDTIGLFRPLTAEQEQLIRNWLAAAGIEEVYSKPLIQLPLGVQRLVLIIRALIKNPPLLILDEPCQGLDETQRNKALALTNLICSQPDITLIYVSHYDDEIPACITHRLLLDAV